MAPDFKLSKISTITCRLYTERILFSSVNPFQKQKSNNPIPSLNFAEADGPPNSADDPYLGTSQKVDHKDILFPTCFERLAVFKDQSLSIDAVIKSGPLQIGAHSEGLYIENYNLKLNGS